MTRGGDSVAQVTWSEYEPQGQLLGQYRCGVLFSSLKKERIKKQIYKNRELAKADVAHYIDSFYNRMRRHSHLGGLSPEQFEAAHNRGDKVSTKSCELHTVPKSAFEFVRHV